jgi:hypothetical protein
MTVLAAVFFCPRNWLFTQSNLTHLHRNVVIFSIKDAGALEIRCKKSANTRRKYVLFQHFIPIPTQMVAHFVPELAKQVVQAANKFAG